MQSITIESLEGAGNSASQNHYSTFDSTPWNGITYYRLKQIDFDGKEEVFGPTSASCTNEKMSMSVFPNPIEDQFIVEINSHTKVNDITIQLTDMTGRVIGSQMTNIKKGINQVYFNQNDLQEGIYMIRLIGDKEKTAPIKVMKN